jgi:hypothetical protein
MIGQIMVNNYPSMVAQSFPFIGDIDGFVEPGTGKKHPEICVTVPTSGSGGSVIAYKYNSTTNTIVQKWILPTSDRSGGTAITLFDFNNDGISELVYRDETVIRILNGIADGTAPVLASANATFSCISGTAFEYPVIADINGDGSANICVTCAAGYTGSPNYVRTYESSGVPWAPARSVWNQVNYEPLYINNDLTVPAVAFPKNREFNGRYLYNGALIQVPIVNKDFVPVVQAADAAITGFSLELRGQDSVYVHVKVHNIGVKNTNATLPLSVYRNGTYTAPAFVTQPIGKVLTPCDSI